MRDKASSGTWLSWLTVSIGGAAMLGVFALAGGVGGGQRGVATAVAATSTSTSSTSTADLGGPVISGLTTPSCVGGTLTGAVNVSDKFTGPVTLGLFVISNPKSPLVRSFTDTGQRVTVNFNGVYRGSFTFNSIPSGSAGYLVAVVPASGTIDPATQYVESTVVPTCNTVTTTLTDTTTTTALTTTLVTFTQVSYVTVTTQIRSIGCVFNNVPVHGRIKSRPQSQIAKPASINPCSVK